MRKTILTKDAPKPLGPYSQAVQVGNFLFISGQLAISPKEGKIVGRDIAEQTRQVMENIKAILETAGYSFKDVIQSTIYLSSMMLFKEFNIEYTKYFTDKYPVRITVGAELVPNALVEISVIACKD